MLLYKVLLNAWMFQQVEFMRLGMLNLCVPVDVSNLAGNVAEVINLPTTSVISIPPNRTNTSVATSQGNNILEFQFDTNTIYFFWHSYPNH